MGGNLEYIRGTARDAVGLGVYGLVESVIVLPLGGAMLAREAVNAVRQARSSGEAPVNVQETSATAALSSVNPHVEADIQPALPQSQHWLAHAAVSSSSVTTEQRVQPPRPISERRGQNEDRRKRSSRRFLSPEVHLDWNHGVVVTSKAKSDRRRGERRSL